MEDVVQQTYEPLLQYLQQHPEIQQAILFGSLARGQAHMESDVDLAVALNHVLDADEKMRMVEDIALVMGRAVSTWLESLCWGKSCNMASSLLAMQRCLATCLVAMFLNKLILCHIVSVFWIHGGLHG